MKIVHLITGLSTGGAENMLSQLVARMDQDRFKNVVVSMTDGGHFGKLMVAAGIPVYELGMRRGGADPRGILRLIGLLRRETPQILQTWLYHSDLLGLVAGRIAGVPAIAWNLRCAELRREDHSPSLFRLLWLLARLSAVPQAVVANSEAGMRAHLTLGYHPRRWEILPNGFDLDRLKPDTGAAQSLALELGLPAGVVLIGMIARYHPMKDHAMLLRTVAGLDAKVVLLLAGRGVDTANKELTAAIERLRLSNRVRLLGERHDVARLTAALDIAVSSSYSEGFSNTIGEAMACGVPCVVTDVGDSAAIVGDTGFVVPPRDPVALAAALQRMIDLSLDERARMGAKARARIAKEYSLDTIVSRYETLYRELGSG